MINLRQSKVKNDTSNFDIQSKVNKNKRLNTTSHIQTHDNRYEREDGNINTNTSTNMMTFNKTNNDNELKRKMYSSTPNIFNVSGLKRDVTFIEPPVKTELKTFYQNKIPSS